MKIKYILAFVFLSIIFISCQNDKNEEKKDWHKINEQLIDVNKYLVKEDRERIESFIKRNEWNMTQTETGMWYEIYEKGKGELVKENDIATINYTITLLDGTLCYSSDSLGALTFKVGRANVESGMHQGIRLMNIGSKARFILPPHLAHGLVGDDNKIPPRSIIVYDVELLRID